MIDNFLTFLIRYSFSSSFDKLQPTNYPPRPQMRGKCIVYAVESSLTCFIRGLSGRISATATLKPHLASSAGLSRTSNLPRQAICMRAIVAIHPGQPSGITYQGLCLTCTARSSIRCVGAAVVYTPAMLTFFVAYFMSTFPREVTVFIVSICIGWPLQALRAQGPLC